MDNKNVRFNHTLKEYNRRYRHHKNLLKLTKQEVEDFDRQFNTVGQHYVLRKNKWWFIDGIYYQVPKKLGAYWFRNLNAGVQAATCLLGAGVIATAITVPLVLLRQPTDETEEHIAVIDSDIEGVTCTQKKLDNGALEITLSYDTSKKELEDVTVTMGNQKLLLNSDYTLDENKIVIAANVLGGNKAKEIVIKPVLKDKEEPIEKTVSFNKTAITPSGYIVSNIPNSITEGGDNLAFAVTNNTGKATVNTIDIYNTNEDNLYSASFNLATGFNNISIDNSDLYWNWMEDGDTCTIRVYAPETPEITAINVTNMAETIIPQIEVETGKTTDIKILGDDEHRTNVSDLCTVQDSFSKYIPEQKEGYWRIKGVEKGTQNITFTYNGTITTTVPVYVKEPVVPTKSITVNSAPFIETLDLEGITIDETTKPTTITDSVLKYKYSNNSGTKKVFNVSIYKDSSLLTTFDEQEFFMTRAGATNDIEFNISEVWDDLNTGDTIEIHAELAQEKTATVEYNRLSSSLSSKGLNIDILPTSTTSISQSASTITINYTSSETEAKTLQFGIYNNEDTLVQIVGERTFTTGGDAITIDFDQWESVTPLTSSLSVGIIEEEESTATPNYGRLQTSLNNKAVGATIDIDTSTTMISVSESDITIKYTGEIENDTTIHIAIYNEDDDLIQDAGDVTFTTNHDDITFTFTAWDQITSGDQVYIDFTIKERFVAAADGFVVYNSDSFLNSTEKYRKDQLTSFKVNGVEQTITKFEYTGSAEEFNKQLTIQSVETPMASLAASAFYCGSWMKDKFEEETIEGVSYTISEDEIAYEYDDATGDQLKAFNMNKYGYVTYLKNSDDTSMEFTYTDEPTELKTINLEYHIFEGGELKGSFPTTCMEGGDDIVFTVYTELDPFISEMGMEAGAGEVYEGDPSIVTGDNIITIPNDEIQWEFCEDGETVTIAFTDPEINKTMFFDNYIGCSNITIDEEVPVSITQNEDDLVFDVTNSSATATTHQITITDEDGYAVYDESHEIPSGASTITIPNNAIDWEAVNIELSYTVTIAEPKEEIELTLSYDTLNDSLESKGYTTRINPNESSEIVTSENEGYTIFTYYNDGNNETANLALYKADGTFLQNLGEYQFDGGSSEPHEADFTFDKFDEVEDGDNIYIDFYGETEEYITPSIGTEIELKPGQNISFSINDQNGNPVPGDQVTIDTSELPGNISCTYEALNTFRVTVDDGIEVGESGEVTFTYLGLSCTLSITIVEA